jgi:hypothetical protein
MVIHIRGDMTALAAAGRRGASTGEPIGGWTVIDVMILIATLYLR